MLCSWCKGGDRGDSRGERRDRNAGAGGLGQLLLPWRDSLQGRAPRCAHRSTWGRGCSARGRGTLAAVPREKQGVEKACRGAPGTPRPRAAPRSRMLFLGRRAVAYELLLPAPWQPGHPASSGETFPALVGPKGAPAREQGSVPGWGHRRERTGDVGGTSLQHPVGEGSGTFSAQPCLCGPLPSCPSLAWHGPRVLQNAPETCSWAGVLSLGPGERHLPSR